MVLSLPKGRYFGDVAANYEKARAGEEKWARENEIVRAYINSLPIGSRIADIPYGTGRFAAFYAERGFSVFGADTSPDMLAVAKKNIGGAPNFQIEVASAEALPLPDRSVDYLISHRFVKWLPDVDALGKVLQEFARVTKHEMLIQVKLAKPSRLRKRLSRLLRKSRRPIPNSARANRFSEHQLAKAIGNAGLRIQRIDHHPEIDGGVAYYRIEHIR